MNSHDDETTTDEEMTESDSDDVMDEDKPNMNEDVDDSIDEEEEEEDDDDEEDEDDDGMLFLNGQGGILHEVREADIREGTLEDLTTYIQRSLDRVQNVRKALEPDPDPVAVASIPDECNICYKSREEMLLNMVIMNCGHVMCKECWGNLRSAVCPTCRAGVWIIANVGKNKDEEKSKPQPPVECPQQ